MKIEETFGTKILNWLIKLGISAEYAFFVKSIIIIVGIFLLSYIVFLIARKLIIKVFKEITKRTETTWDDILLEKRVFHRLAYLAPAVLIHSLMPEILTNVKYEFWVNLIQGTLKIYMVIIFVVVIDAFFNAVIEIYKDFKISKYKPIKSYIQIVKIIIYLIAAIIIISIIVGQSPLYLLGGLGALSAVLMLIFRDTLLGFVASIQLSSNDMLRVGDWITVNKFGADGTVKDINLTTVKIENFDKTITTVPTYSLISDAFQNWRGMEEAGVRRIKRSIILNMNSVKFCNNEMLCRFKNFSLIKDYINDKQKEIEDFNKTKNIDENNLINGRRQTNLGILRKYIQCYLAENEFVSKDYTLLVRQLPPTEKGLLIEIYVFSKVTEWTKYEDVVSDIFDHILAIVPMFDLQIFQNPSGSDFKSLINV